MGFDNECIVNIESLPGEYFCPVCRTLIYPTEALQAQCTHLYCKPCLAYTVATTQACPYDGYLVTEADSKPLRDVNKPLVDAIGKVQVHCLYYRSSCPWQGSLSDCLVHCSTCTYGNSPVVCNRCGTQIVHRQVQDHAQVCPGVQTQTTQPIDQVQAQTAAPQAASNQQYGAATTATPAGPGPQHQYGSAPAATLASGNQAGTDQWYQQYCQQYPGYDPYAQYPQPQLQPSQVPHAQPHAAQPQQIQNAPDRPVSGYQSYPQHQPAPPQHVPPYQPPPQHTPPYQYPPVQTRPPQGAYPPQQSTVPPQQQSHPVGPGPYAQQHQPYGQRPPAQQSPAVGPPHPYAQPLPAQQDPAGGPLQPYGQPPPAQQFHPGLPKPASEREADKEAARKEESTPPNQNAAPPLSREMYPPPYGLSSPPYGQAQMRPAMSPPPYAVSPHGLPSYPGPPPGVMRPNGMPTHGPPPPAHYPQPPVDAYSRPFYPSEFGGGPTPSRYGPAEYDRPRPYNNLPPFDHRLGFNGGSFESPRKRNGAIVGWCRICKIDCGTAEELDNHSESKDHQRKSMDMLLGIKQHLLSKKPKLSVERDMSVDKSSGSDKVGLDISPGK